MNAQLGSSRDNPSGLKEELARIEALALRAQAGEMLDANELTSLARSDQRATRGLAKRLLSQTIVRQARLDAGRLLFEACEDLDYQSDAVLNEAILQAGANQRFDLLYELSQRAAWKSALRGDSIQALVRLQNAVVTDNQHGAAYVSDASHLRRLIRTYEMIAKGAEAGAGIRRAARGQRRSPRDGRLRMAHVVLQLVDGGHAPSRSMETMLKFAERDRFDTWLFVSESLAPHAKHAGQMYASHTSAQRGPERIRHIEHDLGIPIVRPSRFDSFIASAAELHAKMAELRIDIAFFHGSLATPIEWLLCYWQAAAWQADAGFGIPLHCPAVDYQFFEFEETMEQLAFMCRERGIPYGYKESGADLSHVEHAKPFERGPLGIPADHVVLGTTGNHLAKRMSTRFCRTVAEVMRCYPSTTYLVVGDGDFSTQAAAFGADLCAGAEPRVRFVGASDEAERWTQTFDIYLNQYPDGGGLSVGDAMSAKKPVVGMKVSDSMYASAAATWLGRENLVHPATDQAYAERLTLLIQDPKQRAALGAALRRRYVEKFDARRWVRRMNDRILDVVNRTVEAPAFAAAT